MTSPDEERVRRSLVDAVRQLDAIGLNVNASGNLSARLGEEVLVTPTGLMPAATTADDVVLLDLRGRPARDGQRDPTSEWRLHTEIYRRRADVGAIVHTHAPESTAAATIGRAVPAIHYVAARFGGTELRCASYATYGTEELALAVAGTLGVDRHACLMANHGAIAVAGDLAGAIALATDVEWFCGVHRRAVSQGTPRVLDADEMAVVSERFASYGQPSGPPTTR